ncbi:flagellar motor protein MotB [Pseudoxanthomonas composti]|uniref:Motility protein MotB n=1 Tax=Pseudoxanthomonas composti TaxID=2137479 RepID=A0A4Q1JTA2_9GAMM|nr:flagellar motor protein MotB [Pseudoxanthomonas composti]RXR03551.1 motility protein MotB [Pseudoxanthomonas composti]
MSDKKPPIIVKRVKKVAGGHHGGAWKVAYADFVTAMMAFFLVMWLVGTGTKQEKAAIAEYFKNPSAFNGKAQNPGMSSLGPGGAADKMIPTSNAMAIPGGVGPDAGQKKSEAEEKADAEARDKRQLTALKQELEAAIEKSLALAPFKDQLLIDLTPEGLRIQIVDKLNRPMFDLGGVTLKDYATEILKELGAVMAGEDHRIAISGHTDETPFHAQDGYGNWELSSERANAARRALIKGGLEEAKITRVVGLAASVPFDKTDPRSPVNRRISIVVLNKQALDQAAKTDTPIAATSQGAETEASTQTEGAASAPVPASGPSPAAAAVAAPASPAPAAS